MSHETSYRTSLFLFRRDLRLIDNTALLEATKVSKTLIPAFIFDPRQVHNNVYRGDSAVQFMMESLREIDELLRGKESQLFCFEGKADEVLEDLLQKKSIDAVFCNRDYTPFAQKRDDSLESICKKHGVAFHAYHDALLQPPGSVLKNDGKPYSVYTPFYRKASQSEVLAPRKAFKKSCTLAKRVKGARSLDACDVPYVENSDIFVRGGRKEGLKLLGRACTLSNYDDERNIPALEGTSGLSAHHKFGTLSIREVYHKIREHLGESHTLIRELYWRDFFTHIIYHYPRVLGGCFYTQYEGVAWDNNKSNFKKWCEGRTGFPLVDAGMRELHTTGFMHNRVRMVVASFLTKDLHIDWRWGEKYFAQKLVDYDPAVNNGNWQWAASTGCDAQPYFRIFNPWRQQERFDAECKYIKQWIPELAALSPKEIHKLETKEGVGDYPAPMVEHKVAAAHAQEIFAACKK